MITFLKVAKKPGSSQQTINVERNGKPFGQLWTWPNTKTEWHPWHAKPLNGDHKTFDNLKDAKTHMEAVTTTYSTHRPTSRLIPNHNERRNES